MENKSTKFLQKTLFEGKFHDVGPRSCSSPEIDYSIQIEISPDNTLNLIMNEIYSDEYSSSERKFHYKGTYEIVDQISENKFNFCLNHKEESINSGGYMEESKKKNTATEIKLNVKVKLDFDTGSFEIEDEDFKKEIKPCLNFDPWDKNLKFSAPKIQT